MRCEEKVWTPAAGWQGPETEGDAAGLVLYFGAREALADGARHRELQAAHPGALVLGCSTGGQIRGEEVEDDGVAALALAFRATRLRLAVEAGCAPHRSRACGAARGEALAGADLTGVFVLSDGLRVNGSALVEGLAAALGPLVPVTGGLAGDGPHFRATLVGAGAYPPQQGLVAAIGLYGDALRLTHGSAGGWEAFGPCRRVTRSEGNILRELDGAPAPTSTNATWGGSRRPARHRAVLPAAGLEPGPAGPRRGQYAAGHRPHGAQHDRRRRRAGRLGRAADARRLRPADRRRGGGGDPGRSGRQGAGRERGAAGQLHRPPPAAGPGHA